MKKDYLKNIKEYRITTRRIYQNDHQITVFARNKYEAIVMALNNQMANEQCKGLIPTISGIEVIQKVTAD